MRCVERTVRGVTYYDQACTLRVAGVVRTAGRFLRGGRCGNVGPGFYQARYVVLAGCTTVRFGVTSTARRKMEKVEASVRGLV